MEEEYQRRQQLQSNIQTERVPVPPHQPEEKEEELDEEEKTLIVDESTPTPTLVAEVTIKYLKLGPNENDSNQATDDDHSQTTDSLAKMNDSTHMEPYLSPINSHRTIDLNSATSATPTQLLDAAMELDDSILCHYFSALLRMDDPPLNLVSRESMDENKIRALLKVDVLSSTAASYFLACDQNSKSMIYGDTIGMRLFHLIQRYYPNIDTDEYGDDDDYTDEYEDDNKRALRILNRLSLGYEKLIAFTQLLHEHSKRIHKLMIETIDPHITNQQGQTMLHVIADVTYYSLLNPVGPQSERVNHPPKLTKDLILALIHRGANLLARDRSGKVAIMELVRDPLFHRLDMKDLIPNLMAHNPVELFNITSPDGATVLEQLDRGSSYSVITLLNHLVSERDVFRRINFSQPEFDLLRIQTLNDEKRASFQRFGKFFPPSLHDFVEETKRYELIQTAIEDWIQFNRPTRRTMLEPFLIPDLASIVTDYWFGCEPRESTILLSLASRLNHGTEYFVIELSSSERTLEALRTKIVSVAISSSPPPPFRLQVDEKVIETDADVEALTTGQRINMNYLPDAPPSSGDAEHQMNARS